MWIQADNGVMVNMDHVSRIHYVSSECTVIFRSVTDTQDGIWKFDSEFEAEAALSLLQRQLSVVPKPKV